MLTRPVARQLVLRHMLLRLPCLALLTRLGKLPRGSPPGGAGQFAVAPRNADRKKGFHVFSLFI